MASTITLTSTINWAKSFIANLDPTLMTGSEPALTSANLIRMTMLSAPFVWRWNRVVTGFVTKPGVQDYALTAWVANTSMPSATMIVDINGNCQEVTVAGTTAGTIPVFNVNVNGTTTDGTVTWTCRGSIGTSVTAQSYTLAFLETASVQDTALNPPKWFELEPKLCLGLDSAQARPREIAAQADDAAGRITWRVMPTPNIVYPVNLTLQQRAPLFTNVSNTWAPIPDEYSYIFNWGFLALMLLYGDDPKWGWANQKFVSALLSAQQGLTETERNIFLNNWESLTGQPIQNAIRMQQGNAARGL